MSINSDLNYDVIEAVLSRKQEDNPTQNKELFDVLVSFHEALKPLVKQSRRKSRVVEEEISTNQQNGVAAVSH